MTIENINLTRRSQKTLELSWQSDRQVDVYRTDSVADITIEPQLIGSSDTGLIQINDDCFCKQTFILSDGTHRHAVSERVLPLSGANNFRDCGGYETLDGRRVKWGMLYRSDHLNRLTDEDIEYLHSVKLKSIVDYRNEKEYARQPNRLISSDITTYHFIPDASSAELAAKASNDSEKIGQLIALAQSGNGTLAIDGSGAIMQQQFRDFIHQKASLEAYKQLLNLVARPECLPMNQHCRGGKDRTGFGTAIILALLGVKKEFIYNDFMLTGELRKARNSRRMAQYRQETDNPQVLDFLLSMMETRISYLQAAFDEIDLCYGSFDGYLTQGLGVTQRTIDSIKSLLLTD
jgi:protein-tyrosine phosphatase